MPDCEHIYAIPRWSDGNFCVNLPTRGLYFIELKAGLFGYTYLEDA